MPSINLPPEKIWWIHSFQLIWSLPGNSWSFPAKLIYPFPSQRYLQVFQFCCVGGIRFNFQDEKCTAMSSSSVCLVRVKLTHTQIHFTENYHIPDTLCVESYLEDPWCGWKMSQNSHKILHFVVYQIVGRSGKTPGETPLVCVVWFVLSQQVCTVAGNGESPLSSCGTTSWYRRFHYQTIILKPHNIFDSFWTASGTASLYSRRHWRKPADSCGITSWYHRFQIIRCSFRLA